MSFRCAVYRCYNAQGELLYVGETNWPKDRMRHHERDKPWWPEVDRIDIVWYGSYREALDAEAAAIAAELPRWNKRGHPDWQPERKPRAPWVVRHWLSPGQAAEIIGCTYPQIRKLIKNGRLPSRKLGYQSRIALPVAEAYRDRMAKEAGGE